MAIDTTTTGTSSNPYLALNAKAGDSSTAAAKAAAQASTVSADSFLKLLVTQMQNQDPLNPMDNAQLTSQMAQISTVTGVSELNTTLGSMSSQMLQMQTLQGASLVGRQVLVEGKSLSLDKDGTAAAGYDLASKADRVTLTVKDSAGKVVDTKELGPQDAGRHSFTYEAKDKTAEGLTFEISATASGTAVVATPLVVDSVVAVSTATGDLTLELANGGTIKYDAIKAFS